MKKLRRKISISNVNNNLKNHSQPFVISAPTVAPENIEVSVQNGTVAEVRWDAVPLSTVQGRLKGYKVLAEH